MNWTARLTTIVDPLTELFKGILSVDLFTFSNTVTKAILLFNDNIAKCLYSMYSYHNLLITNLPFQLVNKQMT